MKMIEEWDQRFIEKEWMEEWKEEQKKVIEQCREFRKEMREIAIPLRINWIDEEVKKLEQEVVDAYLNDSQLRKEKKPYWFRKVILNDLRETDKKESMIRKLKAERHYLSNMLRNQESNKVDVSEIKKRIESTITLNSRGFINCPFHEDKTPSMKWFPDSEVFHCFSCGWHGDLIAFIIKRDKMSFKEVIKKYE